MNWRNILSAVLAAGMLILSSTAVLAETELPEETIFDLKSLGILKGDEEGNLHLEDTVTRAEFAELTRRLVQMENWTTSEERTEFSDVRMSDWYYNAVYCMYDLGVINGDGNGMFRPEAPVSTIEAAKMLIAILGYGEEAEQAGGYPKGYQTTALTSGMVRGVEFKDEIDRTDALVMINQCLDLYLNVPSYGVESILGPTGRRETLRDRLMGAHTSEKVYEVKGVVQATASTWIIPGDYEDLADDEIVIDGLLYRTQVPEAAEYIGKQVQCYVAVRDDIRTIQSIRETGKNTVLEIRDEDLVTADSGIISYQTDEKVKNAKLSDTAVLVRNLRLAERWSESDISLAQGSVTLIDNNGDKAYDVIHIQEFETYLISDTKEDIIYFESRTDNQKKKFVNFNNSDTDYVITDQAGAPLKVTDLQKDMAVSVFESQDGSVCKLVAGPAPFTAPLELVREDAFCFDGEEYKAEQGFLDEYQVGDTYQVYLNYRGDLFLLREDTENDSVLQYGYVAEAALDGTMSPQLIAKVVKPGDFVEVEEKSDVEDDDTVTLKLKGQNRAVEELRFSSRVTVNGKLMNADELQIFFCGEMGSERRNRLISYRTNADGEISRIEIPEVVGTELSSRQQKRFYNAKEKLFGGKTLGAFGAEETTKVIMRPDYGNQGQVSDEDYLAAVEINDTEEYTVNGYDIDEDTECVKMISIMATLEYDASAKIKDRDKLSVLEEASVALDEEGSEVIQLTFWSDSAKKSYQVEEDAEAVARALQPGDLFYYALSPSSNQIRKILRVDNALSPDRGEGQFGEPLESDPEKLGQITSGKVSDIVYHKIDDFINRRVDQFIFEFETRDSVTVSVNSRNTPPVYQFNKRNKTIELIETRDIVPGEGTVMIHIKNDTVRGIVYVR